MLKLLSDPSEPTPVHINLTYPSLNAPNVEDRVEFDLKSFLPNREASVGDLASILHADLDMLPPEVSLVLEAALQVIIQGGATPKWLQS